MIQSASGKFHPPNRGYRQMPFRPDRAEGHPCCGQTSLLLVVHRRVFDRLALRIGSAHGDGAALAVGRYDNPARGRNLAGFFVG